jgi:hypothetical protein
MPSVITRGAQSGYRQHIDTSDYGEITVIQFNFEK